MPSFDIVSELDLHELTNAVNQANREVETRFDFKGTNSKFELNDKVITVNTGSEFQVKQMVEILYSKMTKRGIDIGCMEKGDVKESLNKAQMEISAREGIDKDLAKKLIKKIKDSKLKVQASIQGEQVRVTGKKRDDLQQVISMLKSADFELPLQFKNFRD
jgi:uncharacterized protein YajQ (UPF0234 family)